MAYLAPYNSSEVAAPVSSSAPVGPAIDKNKQHIIIGGVVAAAVAAYLLLQKKQPAAPTASTTVPKPGGGTGAGSSPYYPGGSATPTPGSGGTGAAINISAFVNSSQVSAGNTAVVTVNVSQQATVNGSITATIDLTTGGQGVLRQSLPISNTPSDTKLFNFPIPAGTTPGDYPVHVSADQTGAGSITAADIKLTVISSTPVNTTVPGSTGGTIQLPPPTQLTTAFQMNQWSNYVPLTWKDPVGATFVLFDLEPQNNPGAPSFTKVLQAATDTNDGLSVAMPVIGTGNYVLLPDTTYNWSVRATSSVQQPSPTDSSSWGAPAVQTFTTPSVSSSGINAVSPNPSTTVQSTQPVLNWSDSNSHVFQYDVELSTDKSFKASTVYSETINGGTTTPLNSYTPPVQLTPGDWFWHVRPYSVKSVPWSTTWQFTVAGVVTQPAPGGTGTGGGTSGAGGGSSSTGGGSGSGSSSSGSGGNPASGGSTAPVSAPTAKWTVNSPDASTAVVTMQSITGASDFKIWAANSSSNSSSGVDYSSAKDVTGNAEQTWTTTFDRTPFSGVYIYVWIVLSTKTQPNLVTGDTRGPGFDPGLGYFLINRTSVTPPADKSGAGNSSAKTLPPAGSIDLNDFKAHFGTHAATGTTVQSANWNPVYDINGDGTVDIVDYGLAQKNGLFSVTTQPPTTPTPAPVGSASGSIHVGQNSSNPNLLDVQFQVNGADSVDLWATDGPSQNTSNINNNWSLIKSGITTGFGTFGVDRSKFNDAYIYVALVLNVGNQSGVKTGKPGAAGFDPSLGAFFANRTSAAATTPQMSTNKYGGISTQNTTQPVVVGASPAQSAPVPVPVPAVPLGTGYTSAEQAALSHFGVSSTQQLNSVISRLSLVPQNQRTVGQSPATGFVWADTGNADLGITAQPDNIQLYSLAVSADSSAQSRSNVSTYAANTAAQFAYNQGTVSNVPTNPSVPPVTLGTPQGTPIAQPVIAGQYAPGYAESGGAANQLRPLRPVMPRLPERVLR